MFPLVTTTALAQPFWRELAGKARPGLLRDNMTVLACSLLFYVSLSSMHARGTRNNLFIPGFRGFAALRVFWAVLDRRAAAFDEA